MLVCSYWVPWIREGVWGWGGLGSVEPPQKKEDRDGNGGTEIGTAKGTNVPTIVKIQLKSCENPVVVRLKSLEVP